MSSKAEERKAGEKEITYSELKMLNNQQQPIRSSREREPAPVYAAVRTGDLSYGQIHIREPENKQRIREREPAPVYAAVRTGDLSYGQIHIKAKRPKRTRELKPEPDVVYSPVGPATSS
ncbi:uncharacterized protein FYW61_019747 [Anableps anableps]